MNITKIATPTNYFFFTNARDMFVKHLTPSGVSMSWNTPGYFTPEDARRLHRGPCKHLKLNESEV